MRNKAESDLRVDALTHFDSSVADGNSAIVFINHHLREKTEHSQQKEMVPLYKEQNMDYDNSINQGVHL